MRDRKMRDWKMRHQTAMVENAGLENAGNDIVWNTVYSLCLSRYRLRVLEQRILIYITRPYGPLGLVYVG